MGYKHLEKIEKFLKNQKNKVWWTRRDIMIKLNANYYTICNALVYLEKQKKVIKTMNRGPIYYRWNWKAK